MASCTERKRDAIPEELQLRSVTAGSLETRVKRWWERLQRQPALSRYTAGQLYCGEHWTLAQRCVASLNSGGRSGSLWAASAGYGLVPDHALLAPYSATFAKGPDSVVGSNDKASRIEQIQLWWNRLATFEGPAPGPRSIRELAKRSPKGPILIVASPDYIRAMRADLLVARNELSSPELLSVISNHDLLSDEALSPHLIPVDERSSTVLGIGTMQGLNARVALRLIEETQDGSLTAPRLQERYERMVRHAEKPVKPNRDRMGDQDVVEFLRSELTRNPRAGWTLLLRALRQSGKACEQNRFRELHKTISEEILQTQKS